MFYGAKCRVIYGAIIELSAGSQYTMMWRVLAKLTYISW